MGKATKEILEIVNELKPGTDTHLAFQMRGKTVHSMKAECDFVEMQCNGQLYYSKMSYLQKIARAVNEKIDFVHFVENNLIRIKYRPVEISDIEHMFHTTYYNIILNDDDTTLRSTHGGAMEVYYKSSIYYLRKHDMYMYCKDSMSRIEDIFATEEDKNKTL